MGSCGACAARNMGPQEFFAGEKGGKNADKSVLL